MNDGIRWGLPALAIAAVGTVGIALGLTAFANFTSDRLTAGSITAGAKVEDVVGELKGAATMADGQSLEARQLAEGLVEDFGDPALAETVLADASEADELIAAASAVTVPAPLTTDRSPLSPIWVSIGEATAASDRLGKLAKIGSDASSQLGALADAEDLLAAERTELYADAAADAQAVLDASTFATYESRIGAMHAIAQEGEGWYVDPDTADGYDVLVAAVGEVQASQAAEAARRAAPEYASRGPVEDFARSISHGVSLDFEWNHVVNGLSSDQWYSGTAQYWYGDGGWGKINLSYSIDWNYADDINAKALVVHEVGHTQVVRPECAPIFESATFNRDDEMWATAWAIASGYDVQGAGISAYGRPSDEQIAAAAGCI